MQYKTHLLTSLAIAIPVMSVTNTSEPEMIVALCVGILLPDIDEPHSWIGQRTRGLSDLLHGVLGHRGFTHSLISTGLIASIMVMISFFTQMQLPFAVYFTFGYFLHLLEDSFSKSGIAWFLPFSIKRYHSGFEVLYYKTGGISEYFILIVAAIVIIMQFVL